ncbi:MAG: hypothetical protein HY928_05955 [Elusimicrobia bacterium]|nr:hypothetical protein [Elusimicrobiota bacterium]
MFAVAVSLPFLAGPARSQTKEEAFDAGFRAALAGYLAESSENPEAAAASAFLASESGLRFESSRLSGVRTGLAEALYVPTKRAVVISAESLAASGIEPTHWNIPQETLVPAISRMAPLLIHELFHARVHHELGFSAPVFENELCAYAAEARYVAAEPRLATRENFSAGSAFLAEQVPLVLERMALLRRLPDLYKGSKAALEAGDAEKSLRLSGEFMAVERRKVEVEARMGEKQKELAARFRLPLQSVEGLMLWVAYSKDWETLRQAVSHVRLPSLETASWGDEAQARAARDYFAPLAARLAAESGGGFREPMRPAEAAAAPVKTNGGLRLAVGIGGVALFGWGLLSLRGR